MDTTDNEFLTGEMRKQLSFLFQAKEALKDLDDRIRGTAFLLARMDLAERHAEITEWITQDRPDEASLIGMKGGKEVVSASVRTMSLHGKSGFGGRQNEAMKKNIEKISSNKGEYRYLFLLDPWTVKVVNETFKPEKISVLPLLKEDLAPVVRAQVDQNGMGMISFQPEAPVQRIEEVITKEEVQEERVIISPISNTSLRQGFLYIPKDRGALLKEGNIKIWIRKDASLVSKCMISQTGGVRIGGGLTKWFRSMGLQPDDELVMGVQEDGALLVLMVRRVAPYMGQKPVVENIKWEGDES